MLTAGLKTMAADGFSKLKQWFPLHLFLKPRTIAIRNNWQAQITNVSVQFLAIYVAKEVINITSTDFMVCLHLNAGELVYRRIHKSRNCLRKQLKENSTIFR